MRHATPLDAAQQHENEDDDELPRFRRIAQGGTAALRDFSLFDDHYGSMLLKKDFEGGLWATSIQSQRKARNLDSKICSPGIPLFQIPIPQRRLFQQHRSESVLS
jgi:hypothetical protein